MPDTSIDSHVHVGLAGDEWPGLGKFSAEYRSSTVFKSFLTFVRLPAHDVKESQLQVQYLDTVFVQ